MRNQVDGHVCADLYRCSLLPLFVTVLLAGCGGGGGSTSTPGSTAGTTTTTAATTTTTASGATTTTPATTTTTTGTTTTTLVSGPPSGAACPTTNSAVATAGGIQLAMGASRATGVAPLAVFFDATVTTAAGTARPFHDLEYRWNFGDTGSGTWGYGAKAGTSARNAAMGPVAAHVFESAGVYPITVSAFNGTTTVSYTCDITVTSADVEFAGSKTVCVSGAADFAGCPSGATQVTSTNPTTAVANNIASGNRRILFRRGESFNVGSSIAINRGGPSMLGAFGAGAKPVFTATSSSPIINLSSESTPTGVSDWRFQDLALDGGVSGAIIFFGNGHASRVLINRVDTSNTQGSLTLSGSHLATYNTTVPFTHAIWDEFYMVDSSLDSLYNANGNGIFANSNRMVVMGNLFDTKGAGEHGVRMQLINRGVISNNTFQGIATGKHHLTLRGVNFSGSNTVAAGTYSEKVVVSDNKFTGGVNAEIMTMAAQYASANERGRNFIVERNWFDGSASSQSLVKSAFTDVTVRNNIAHIPNNNGGSFANVKDEDTSGVFFPDRVHVYNNSVYHASTSSNYFSMFFASTNTHNLAGATFEVKNNILYAPGAGFAVMIGNTSSGTIASSNNTANPATSPQFATSPPTAVNHFTPAAGSYANGAGTNVNVYSDFHGVTTPTPQDMGAVIH